MKFVAHPLVVAVALGLVDADVLSTFDDEPAPCTDCAEGEAAHRAAAQADVQELQDALDEALASLRVD